MNLGTPTSAPVATRVALVRDLRCPYNRHAEVSAGVQRYAEERGWVTIVDAFAHDTLHRRRGNPSAATPPGIGCPGGITTDGRSGRPATGTRYSRSPRDRPDM